MPSVVDGRSTVNKFGRRNPNWPLTRAGAKMLQPMKTPEAVTTPVQRLICCNARRLIPDAS
jgi:hypothetical protein